MCPACITTAVMITASATSTGGVAAILHAKIAALRRASKRAVNARTGIPARSRKEVSYGTEVRHTT
jgi:hypothetical protein